MLDAAKAAEAVLTSSLTPSMEEADDDPLEPIDGRASPSPSQAPQVDVSGLTPQTFLVRPTRPDANRNRGRKPFKRRPPPAQITGTAVDPGAPVQAGTAASVNPPEKGGGVIHKANVVVADAPEMDEGASEDGFDEDLVPEMEHLQLGLEEAWFLSAGLGVLRVFDPATVSSFFLCSPIISS